MLTRRQSRTQGAVHLRAFGYHALSRCACTILVVAATWLLSACSNNERFGFGKGDRIAIVGNSLAERLQHDGWLESYIQAVHPDHQLVFRNLGYSGDQVHYRPRAHEGFGDSDSHLDSMKANVILGFFGYNESFQNNPQAFKEHLAAWIDYVRSQKYDAVAAPRIVLFSPIAHEDFDDPNLPDGVENNQRLAAYTQAMKEIAAGKGVFFVDLFTASLNQYKNSHEPLTINGIHLNERGNEFVARYFVEHAVGEDVITNQPTFDLLRQAVIDKNDVWFRKYRAASGNDVWGTRSSQDGNKETLQREQEMLTVMTANRDYRIWALAAGKDIEIDDNVPEPRIVGTQITRDVEYTDDDHSTQSAAVTTFTRKGKVLDLRADAVAQLTIEASQLQFDVSEVVVKSGQLVKLKLSNLDLMQHNLLIVEPGAADEVAQLAIELGAKGPEKKFVPESGKVLHATGLLVANSSETLGFVAPKVAGDYPFVCTFPGHAPVMRGVIKVVQMR